MEKKILQILALTFIIVAGAFYFFDKTRVNQRSQSNKTPNIKLQTSSAILTETQITQTLTPSPTLKLNLTNMVPTSIPGGVQGKLTCGYPIPAAPNMFGTASLNSTWVNLMPGKNGKAYAELCVSSDGGTSKTVITTLSGSSGISTTEAPWISNNSNYFFYLFDTHGGNLPQCSGIQLSTCEIHTK